MDYITNEQRDTIINELIEMIDDGKTPNNTDIIRVTRSTLQKMGVPNRIINRTINDESFIEDIEDYINDTKQHRSDYENFVAPEDEDRDLDYEDIEERSKHMDDKEEDVEDSDEMEWEDEDIEERDDKEEDVEDSDEMEWEDEEDEEEDFGSKLDEVLDSEL